MQHTIAELGKALDVFRAASSLLSEKLNQIYLESSPARSMQHADPAQTDALIDQLDPDAARCALRAALSLMGDRLTRAIATRNRSLADPFNRCPHDVAFAEDTIRVLQPQVDYLHGLIEQSALEQQSAA